MTLTDLVRTRRVLICAGAGGVGKTTTSAALGLLGAELGRRSLVLTVDPARRLANALGLDRLDTEEHVVPPADLRGAGVRGRGSYSVMMLDTQRTFDALIERHAPSPEVAQRILKNRFYQELSRRLAGTHEFMAMEKLLEVRDRGRHDLLVLDTPPMKHALDLLSAPERLGDVLDSSVLRWFLLPYFRFLRLGVKTLERSAQVLFRLAERIAGGEFLKDFADFFLDFEGLYQGFRDRSERVQALLKSRSVALLLVTLPSPVAVEQAREFLGRVKGGSIPFAGIVVNRCLPFGALPPDPPAARIQEELPEGAPPDLADRVLATARRARLLQAAEEKAVGELSALAPRSFTTCVPLLEDDPTNLQGLHTLARSLRAAPRGARR